MWHSRFLAQEAGRILMDLRAAGTHEGKALGAQGDALANAFLMEALAQHRPDDGVLSEETADTPARLRKSACGSSTRSTAPANMARAGRLGGPCRPGVGGKAVLGAVALPGLDLVLDSAAPPPLPPMAPCRACWSAARARRARRSPWQGLGGELVPMGSAGAKAMAVCAARRKSTFIRAASTNGTIARPWPWRRARAACLAHRWFAAGLQQCRTWLPDLLICRANGRTGA
jgi:3'(2'), 5'-bisphosphate nucleotidase